MFDLSLKTMLSYAVLSIPALVMLSAVLFLVCIVGYVLFDESPNELQDCCEQAGMEFVLKSEYHCLDYQNHKILSVVQQNNQCFYGE